MTQEKLWGWHLSVDASYCDLNKIKDGDNIYKFTKHLVKDIDMEAYGEPQIVFFGNGDKSGYTLQQLISTSNICAHFVDEYNSAFFDVFSCKPFEPEIVVNLIKEYFGATHIKTTVNNRVCVV